MSKSKSPVLFLILVFVFSLLLSACGSVQPAAPSPALPDGAPSNVVEVSTVDEFLSAIASNTTIHLAEGCYDLTTASGYGKPARGYKWQEAVDGYMLVISDVHDLAIVGSGADKTEFITPHEYADVLAFDNVENVTLSGLMAGHSVTVGNCGADVIRVSNSENFKIQDCTLYGCGLHALFVTDTRNFTVSGSVLRDCSSGALVAFSCRDFRVENCSITGCGYIGDSQRFALIDFEYCSGTAVINSSIKENLADRLLFSCNSKGVYLLGTEVADNYFSVGAFATGDSSPVVESCSFENNDMLAWYDMQYTSSSVVSSDGHEYLGSELIAMQRSDVVYDGPGEIGDYIPYSATGENNESLAEYNVSTVDEFLAAIGPDRIINLAPGEYKLSAASCYPYGSTYYWSWEEVYDGFELVIKNVNGMTVLGSGTGSTTISASPRYADVLSFQSCVGIYLAGFTAGHTEAPGTCAGGVLDFYNCYDSIVDNCGLFGCGILGIRAASCSGMSVTNTEIYDCSEGAVELYNSSFDFYNCTYRDCGSPAYYISESTVTFDGDTLPNGYSDPPGKG